MRATDYYNPQRVPAHAYWDWWHNEGRAFPVYIMIKMLAKRASIETFKGKVMVDLGSGPGTSLVKMAKKFKFEKCHAIDSANYMLEFAKGKVPSVHGLTTQQADIENDAWNIGDRKAGLVMACASLGSIESLDVPFAEAGRVLASKGYFAFDVWTHLLDTQNGILRQETSMDAYAHPRALLISLAQSAGLEFVDIHNYRGGEIAHGENAVRRHVFLYRKK